MNTQVLISVVVYLVCAATIGRLMGNDGWITWRTGSFAGFRHGFLNFPINYVFGGIGNYSVMRPPVAWFISRFLLVLPSESHDHERRWIYRQYVWLVALLWLPRIVLNLVMMIVCGCMICVRGLGVFASRSGGNY